MALSTAQKVTLFQILEVPFAESYRIISDMGAPSVTFLITAKTAIEDWLTNSVYPVSGLETELTDLLTSWETIGTSPLRIDNGSVGSITGITLDYDRQRAIIAARVKLIVPFYKEHERLEQASGGGISLGIRRV